MKVLVIGAGGVGGYFGGRLIQSGADVTFLVRERRARQLAEHGLVIKSPLGDAVLPVRTITSAGPGQPFDLILVTCKSYDLASSIGAAAPHMKAGAGLAMPLLNGMAHIDVLRERFGQDRVLGGLCGIFATLSPEGAVVQMEGLPPRLSFGRFKDQIDRKMLDAPASAIEQMMEKANFTSKRIEPIEQGLWEKWVLLTVMAAGTCLMRGSVGSIVATEEGKAVMEELLAETTSVARAAGYPPSDQHLNAARGMLTAAGSNASASMLRDIQKGGATEGDHILGDMLRRARRFGLSTPLLRIANVHLQTYEAERRKAGS
ncbi:ketopantoate reductase family protein [Dongia deserti]|uniref:ketopantoate reductase family protein n=1 Tax=Dongia deserti TaxID=2268030 RepID=UPI000E64654A|nr:ketopantoate reductase family protein [Dongia deserti]